MSFIQALKVDFGDVSETNGGEYTFRLVARDLKTIDHGEI